MGVRSPPWLPLLPAIGFVREGGGEERGRHAKRQREKKIERKIGERKRLGKPLGIIITRRS